MIVLISVLIVLGLLNPFYPIQNFPQNEVRVAAGTQATPVTLHQAMKPRVNYSDAHLVKQQYDYSCGSAALATLLNYYLGENFTERQVIEGLVQHGDRQQIERLRAFSLLDMKRFVEKLGYKGAGYNAQIDDLRTLGKPCIVPVEIFGYQHFCVFRGIVQDHVFLADPYLGNTSFTVAQFREMWKRSIAFIVTDGEIVHSALTLKEEDLRFIDLDATRRALDTFRPPSSIMMEQLRIDRAAGVPVVR